MSKENSNLLGKVLGISINVLIFLFLMYLFLLAISLLGDSFKLLGKGVAESLFKATANPFSGLMIGLLVTSLIQSSSATTSMIVALVSAGGLEITAAIPMVMGANIGTTITNTIVSIGHITRNDEFERAYAGSVVHDCFNILTVCILLPFELMTGSLEKTANFLSNIFYGAESSTFTSPVKVFIKPVEKIIINFFEHHWGMSKEGAGILGIILGFALIFFALTYIVKFMRRVTASNIEENIRKVFSANAYVIIAIGILITVLVQSSSITTSLLVPLLGANIMTLEQAFPLTVGANIGTTVTALLASMAGNQAGLTIALVHLLFNLSGFALFYPIEKMRNIPIACAKWLARITVKNKKLALIYIATVFFIIPFLGMWLFEQL
ncbi:MAG: hypothetical protein COX62_04225 [Deltaproteobacteria bacterium CG_4_10_14_0_2_um_filter_43_8]|nr:MAG: hypothetical protein COV43_04220 [Deltaproteobacteria bacterium CG11_big_fil_rev_8_21_14_0_20_42_23]PJA20676.1 MAG: hypothetical protein COX62_04225 [Deltaproteobacteria bacterium CG_4_10_14_0_2_um_filter_43_8]PJC64476.1 MAG: hypothetical protein CO021_04035 [Deltaproteobacteria bacterium CG_4_9_14_0_2_um_filter_42_21]